MNFVVTNNNMLRSKLETSDQTLAVGWIYIIYFAFVSFIIISKKKTIAKLYVAEIFLLLLQCLQTFCDEVFLLSLRYYYLHVVMIIYP